MIQQIISDSPWHPAYFFSCPTWQVKKDQRVVAMLGAWEVWKKGARWESGMWYLYRGWGQSNILWRALGLWALQATRGRARAGRGGCLPISLIHRDLPSWGNLKFPEGSGDQRLIPYRKSWFAWEALQVGEGGLSVLPTLVRCSYVWKVVLSSHWREPSGTGDCSSFGWDDWTLWRKQWMMQRSCSRWNHFDPKS